MLKRARRRQKRFIIYYKIIYTHLFRFVKREIYQIFDEMKWKFTFEIKSQEMYNIRGCIHRLVDKYVYNSAYMLAHKKEGYKKIYL